MAVARMSAFVATVMRKMLAGIFTVNDNDLFRWLSLAKNTQDIRLEPSAAAGFAGPAFIVNHPQGHEFCLKNGLSEFLKQSTHIIWTTGGSFVPNEQYTAFLKMADAMS